MDTRIAWALAAWGFLSCENDAAGPRPGPISAGEQLPILSCTFTDSTLLSGGVARDGIPSLQNPPLVALNHPDARYLDEYEVLAASDANSPELRVVGIFLDSIPVAIPFNVLWRHEIVNLDVAGRRIAVSYCPLTATAIAFDLTTDGISRLGVSGLIFQNNLIMFDEGTGSLWPQMCLAAESGSRRGNRLTPIPVVDMRWREWKRQHPNSRVVGSDTGWMFDYTRYPFLSYEFSDLLLFPLPYLLDQRVPMKERVLGIMDDGGGIAIPFGQLETTGATAALRFAVDGGLVTVLWDRDASAAMAFRPVSDAGDPATLAAVGGRFIDDETGSVWTIDGRAISGPRAGERLQHYGNSYVAYWFAWASFFPRTRVWNE